MMLGQIMAGRRLNAYRLSGLTVALSASVLMLISSQLPWVGTTSPVAFDYWIGVRFDNSGGLDVSAMKVLVIAALAVAVLAVASLIPYLRALCAVVVVIGGVCIALALGVMSEINKPATGNLVGHIVSSASQRGPGTGIYVLIAGSTLAIISGALTLLSPRVAPARYRYGAAPYDNAPEPWPRQATAVAGQAGTRRYRGASWGRVATSGARIRRAPPAS
jgi:uncharacterized membrane protein (TIGR02234 family)